MLDCSAIATLTSIKDSLIIDYLQPLNLSMTPWLVPLKPNITHVVNKVCQDLQQPRQILRM